MKIKYSVQSLSSKIIFLTLLSFILTSCGTNVGIQIEKAIGVTDFILLNDGAEYTNNSTLKIQLTTMNQLYSLRTNLAECESSIPLNWISGSMTIEDPYKSAAYAPNDVNTYYVKYISLDGSNSGCLSDSVIYDNRAPNVPVVSLKSNGGSIMMPIDIINVSPTIEWEAVTDDESVNEWSGLDYYTVDIHEIGANGVSDNAFISKKIDRSLIKTLLTGYSTSLSFLDSESQKYNRNGFNAGSSYVAYVYAIDKAGNKSNAGKSVEWSLDQTPPVISGIKLTSNDLNQSGLNQCYMINNSVGVQFATTGSIPTVDFYAEDVVDPLTGVGGSGLSHLLVDIIDVAATTVVVSAIRVDASALTSVNLASLASSQGKSYTLQNNTSYALKVKAFDKAGNESASALLSNSSLNSYGVKNYWLVDKNAPVMSLSTLPTIADINTNLLPAQSLPVITDAEGLLSVGSFYIEDVGNSNQYVLSQSLVADRRYQIKSIANDCVGNTSTVLSSNQFCVDKTNPTLAAMSAISSSNLNTTTKTFNFTSPALTDATPSGGSCNSGAKGIQYQLVRVDGSGVEISPLGAGDFTILGAVESVSGTKSISYTSLVTGNYKLKIIGYDNVGNKVESLSAASVGISNDPPNCTNQTLNLVSSPQSTLEDISGVKASKISTHTVKLDYSNVVCYADSSNSATLSGNDFSVELYDSQNNPISVTSPQHDTANKTYYASASLVSGKSYYFRLIATNVGSLKTNLNSGQWLVDSSAPNKPNSIVASTGFMKETTSTPSFTITLPTDLPVVSATSNQVGVKDLSLEVYESSIAGVATGSAVYTSGDLSASSTTIAAQTVSGLTNGKYYTGRIKARDNLLNIGSLSDGAATSTWLVDTTIPVINHSFISAAPVYTSTTSSIAYTLRARNYTNGGTAMITDPVPGAGLVASGIDETKNSIHLFRKSNITGSSVNSGATPVLSLQLTAAQFGTAQTWSVSSVSSDIYRMVFSTIDKANNQSVYYVDSQDIVITNTKPSCAGTVSLATNANVGSSYSSGNSIYITSATNSPDLTLSGVSCVDGLGNAITTVQIEFWQDGDASKTGLADNKTLPISPNHAKTFGSSLSVDKKYLFKLVPVDSNGLVGNAISTDKMWIIDNNAPTNPTSIGLTPSTYMNIASNGGTTTPTVSWNASTEQPATLNSGLKQYQVKVYTSNSSGARSSLVTTETVTHPTLSYQKTNGSYTDGLYYTVEVLAEDNIGKVSGSVAASSGVRWLVDTTKPTITNPIASATATNVSSREITVNFAAAGAYTDTTATVGGVASGISTTSYLVKFRNASDVDTTAQSFTPGTSRVFTMSANGKYRPVITVTDNAGNMSAEYIGSEIILSATPTLTLSSTATVNTVSTYPEVNGGNSSAFPVSLACSTDATDTVAHDIQFVIKQGMNVKETLNAVATCTAGVLSLSPVNLNLSSSTTYPNGNYTITGSFTDTYGVVASHTLNITIDRNLKILTFVFDAQENAMPKVINASTVSGRYAVPDVSSPVAFSGTCTAPGTVNVYLVDNNGSAISPVVPLIAQSGNAMLTPANSGTVYTTSCGLSGGVYRFSGNFDYSNSSIAGNITVKANLTDSLGNVSADSNKLYSKVGVLRIPWVGEYALPSDPGILFPSTNTQSQHEAADKDIFESDKKNPRTAWGKAVGTGCNGYKIYYVFDQNGNDAKPLRKSDWTSDYLLLSTKTLSGCSDAMNLDDSTTFTESQVFYGTDTDSSHMVYTCVTAYDNTTAEGPITCSDGYEINSKCPRDFIPISDLTNSGGGSFCVSKYEMARNASGYIIPANKISSHSAPNQLQKYTISDIRSLCSNMSDTPGDYSLITNAQWQLVANSIIQNTNNHPNTVGVSTITGAQGDGSEFNATPSTSDPVTYTGGISSRILEIMDGTTKHYIHDFAGGRMEIVSTQMESTATSSCTPTGYSDSTYLSLCMNPWSSADGQTYFNFSYNTWGVMAKVNYNGSLLIRGGGAHTFGHYSDSLDGIYATHAHSAFNANKGDWYHYTGFRCVSKRNASPYKGM